MKAIFNTYLSLILRGQEGKGHRTLSFPAAAVMRTLAVVFVLLMAGGTVQAGERDKYIGLQAGVMYPRIFSATLSFEKEGRYHNAFEAYVDYFTQWNDCPTCGKVCSDSFWNSRYGLSFGATYKPCVNSTRNSFGRMRFGADLGTNSRSFAAGIEIGYEHVWTLRNRVQLVFIQKNEVNFWAKPTFCNGVQLGIRIPL